MLKQITMALIALFLCATSYAQTPAAIAEKPRYYRPSGCDTLLTQPTETFFCTCNCVTFNPKWITDPEPESIGLNVHNLLAAFDIQMPPEVLQSGRLIGLDSYGPFLSAMFSMPVDGGGVVTTRFTWRFMCRSRAFFFESATRNQYR